MSLHDVVIVGAGASGTMAAIAAAAEDADVVLLEADAKPRRKLLATGNGRCNLSNSVIEPGWIEDGLAALAGGNDGDFFAAGREQRLPLPSHLAYRNLKFASDVLMEMGCSETREVFGAMGLETFEDMEGRIYPITNKARSVSDVLGNQCRALAVQTVLDAEVIEIEPHDGKWACRIGDGRLVHSRSVVVATGGMLSLVSRLGLDALPFVPVLGPLRTENSLSKKMSGVRCRCNASLVRQGDAVMRLSGEVLFRKYGLSGIVVFDISRFARRGDVVAVDIMPGMSHEELAGNIERRVSRGARTETCTCRSALDGLLQPEVADALLSVLEVDPSSRAGKLDPEKLASLIKNLEFEVTEGVCADGAQCARGGIGVESVDPHAMQVRSLPGLFACGEAIDVDAACGGFNLQWAWSSGFAAGKFASRFAVRGAK